MNKILLISLIIFFFFSSLYNISYSVLNFVSQNLTIRESLLNNNNVFLDTNKDGKFDFVNKGIREGGEEYFSLFYKNRKLISHFDFKNIINLYNKIKKIDPYQTEFNKEYSLINKLNNLSSKNRNEIKNTAIYIPKKIRFYWNMSCDTHMVPFIATSISNNAMIFGLPSKSMTTCYGHTRDYGFQKHYNYKEKDVYYESLELKNEQICKIATKKNFKSVIKFDYNSKKEIDLFKIDC